MLAGGDDLSTFAALITLEAGPVGLGGLGTDKGGTVKVSVTGRVTRTVICVAGTVFATVDGAKQPTMFAVPGAPVSVEFC